MNNKMSQLENVTLIKQANIYFDGNVTSRTSSLSRWYEKDLRNYASR